MTIQLLKVKQLKFVKILLKAVTGVYKPCNTIGAELDDSKVLIPGKLYCNKQYR